MTWLRMTPRRFAPVLLATIACTPEPHAVGESLTGATESPTGSSSTAASSTGATADGSTSGGESTSGAVLPIFDLGGVPDIPPPELDPECPDDPDVDASLTGTVLAPNGVLPISGALVYTTTAPPLDLPSGVFCAECVAPPCDPEWMLTAADGTFELPTIAGDDRYLVVRKGGFMRVTPLTITAGTNVVPAAATILPARRDVEAGEFAPKIALLWPGMNYDNTWQTLAEVGLADVEEGSMVAGTNVFDFFGPFGPEIDDGYDFATVGAAPDLLADPDWLEQYQLILAPCFNAWSWVGNEDNLRDWVAKGGKLYATDLSEQLLLDVFAQYQSHVDNPEGYPAMATVTDEGMLAWFDALPEPLRDINVDNPEYGADYFGTLNELPEIKVAAGDGPQTGTAIEIEPVLVPDGHGGQVDVGHRLFLEGADIVTPITVRGEYGCGRIMYSTHHTAGTGDHRGLSPLELALVYMLFELTTCQTPYTPPQG